MKLGVNIDHVATLRQARGGAVPDPIQAALICEMAGAHSIVAHLREDRRHINDNDARLLRKSLKGRFNLEMSIAKDIVAIALKIKPNQVTLVPEKRKELTTEGGLNVVRAKMELKSLIKKFKDKNIIVSLFIDPLPDQIEASKEAGADYIEIHTGVYADAGSKAKMNFELQKISDAAKFACEIGLGVNAGHGLDYKNVSLVSKIGIIEELNIGHSIISQSIFLGLDKAVRAMIGLIK